MDKRQQRGFVVIAFLIIIMLGTALRLLTLRFNSFLEPDVYEYFSIAQQTLANHLVITSAFSGVPPLPFNEQPGLIYIAAIPALITGNLFNTMLIIPVLFAIAEMVCVYVLSFRLSGNKWMALFAMLLFATLNAAILKNSAGEWRGESFVPLFMLLALIISTNEVKTKVRLMLNNFAILALILVSYFTWNAGIYIVPIIAFIYLIALVARQQYTNKWHRIALITIVCTVAAVAALAYLGFPNYATQRIILEQEPFSFGSMLDNFGIVLILALCGAALLIYKEWQSNYPTICAVLASFFVPLGIQLTEVRWSPLLAPAACILAAYFVYEFGKGMRSPILAIGLTALFLMLSIFMMQLPLFGPSGINSQLIQAAQWIGANTPRNSTILTLWPDGSVVEGIAQRPMFSDSMMAATRLSAAFPRFLYAQSGNFSLLNRLQPDYLLVRQWWLNETPALEYQGNLSQSSVIFRTNFANLTRGDSPLPIVYQNNDSIIYCFAACAR